MILENRTADTPIFPMNAVIPSIISALAMLGSTADGQSEQNQVPTRDGTLEGMLNPSTGIRAFKGIPFAKPPVGDLRWQPPQPLEKWQGLRQAHDFDPRAMQRPIFSDMMFRSNRVSEDCLYSAEIEYAMGNLGTNKVYAWTPDDHKVSQQMQDYFANFIKSGNPNGKDLAAPWVWDITIFGAL